MRHERPSVPDASSKRGESLDAAVAVAHILGRIALRTRVRYGLAGLTIALMLTAAGMLAGGIAIGLAAGVVVAATMTWRSRGRWTHAAAAREIEHACPACCNVVVTAEELLRYPDRASAWMRARVLQDAAVAIRSIHPGALVPLTWPVGLSGIAVCLIVALALGFGRNASSAWRATIASVSSAGTVAAATPLEVTVTVTAPAYTGRPVQQVRDPDRIDVIEGSAVRIAATGAGAGWQIRFGARALATNRIDAMTVADVVVSEDSYVAIESRDRAATESSRRLLPVTVIRDRAPAVRLDLPGRDLVLPDAKRDVTVEASASDDFGIRSLEIRYTRVSGTGEQFEFEEGTLPVVLMRDSSVSWKASGRISAAAFKLGPGDALVYRAVARDGRPGDAGLGESDTFFIEIAGPGQAALEGFGMPPNQERYALSQQMIVLKIRRLRARQRMMAHAALAEATASIAAEQRAVRANFVFVMGGHVEDERAGSQPSKENPEGRLENIAQKEVDAAIAHMGRAEQALVVVDTTVALDAARAAAEALERAFGRNRYILRTTSTVSRVDPSRRLTGELSAAGDWRRDLEPQEENRETREARRLLSQMLALASVARAGRSADTRAFASLAEQALAIDPGAAVWRGVARQLDSAGTLSLSGRDATAALSSAIAAVLARIRPAARMAERPGTQSPGPLLGAWAKEQRR